MDHICVQSAQREIVIGRDGGNVGGTGGNLRDDGNGPLRMEFVREHRQVFAGTGGEIHVGKVDVPHPVPVADKVHHHFPGVVDRNDDIACIAPRATGAQECDAFPRPNNNAVGCYAEVVAHCAKGHTWIVCIPRAHDEGGAPEHAVAVEPET